MKRHKSLSHRIFANPDDAQYMAISGPRKAKEIPLTMAGGKLSIRKLQSKFYKTSEDLIRSPYHKKSKPL